MSLALYRKYRPGTFGQVVGQPMIVETLRRQVATGHLAHAYLFMGSRGTGKTSCAKIMAKAVNCLDPKDGDPCGACVCCRGVEDGSLTDVVEIDAASNNGVDSIRDLREEAFYAPAVARYRVYIIDEVHMLSQSAFNALLKIMEEPPAHVIFILSTTEIHKVLPTIISRCQRYDFGRIDSAVIAQRLLFIADEESIPLTSDGAHQIAQLSDGALRDALSLLDVCRAGDKTIDAEAVAAAAGIMGDSHLFELSGYLLKRSASEAIAFVERLSATSLEPGRLCEQLMGHMRSLMLVKTLADPLPLIGCMPHQFEHYKAQARQTKLADIMFCLSELGKAQSAISRTSAKRIEMELAIVRICTTGESSDDNSLAVRVARLEKIVAEGGVAATAPAPLPMPPAPPKDAPKAPAPPPRQSAGAAVPIDAEAPEPPEEEPADGEPLPFEAWGQTLLRLESINRMNAGMLKGSRAYLSGKRVLIDCADPVFLEMMRTQEETRAHIKKAIYLTTGQQFGIGPYRPAAAKEQSDPLEGFIAGLPQDSSIIIR